MAVYDYFEAFFTFFFDADAKGLGETARVCFEPKDGRADLCNVKNEMMSP